MGPEKAWRPGEQFVQDAAERPDVAAPIHGPATSLLGAHVGRGPHHFPQVRQEPGTGRGRCGLAAGLGLSRETEIKNLDDAVGREPDVGRLQVAMHQTFVMRGFERARDLHGNPECGRRLEHARA